MAGNRVGYLVGPPPAVAEALKSLSLLQTDAAFRYFVITRWESEEAFQNWRSGQAFQHQHRETHEDEGKGEAKPQHPVATGASLLEFEVVSLTQA